VAFTPQAQPAVPLYIAIQRELSRKGYANVPSNEAGLRAAILVYEYDAGMNLTGEMKEELLKKLLFDYAPAPRGALADRIETDRKFVTGVQKLLFELGFFSGTLSGQMDSWTIAAVKQFERYRKLPETGRLNEITLLELSRYAGQPLPNDVAGR
jgi:peptidoglycan hydrolase-like protein with peptidoglycan-binding domain